MDNFDDLFDGIDSYVPKKNQKKPEDLNTQADFIPLKTDDEIEAEKKKADVRQYIQNTFPMLDQFMRDISHNPDMKDFLNSILRHMQESDNGNETFGDFIKSMKENPNAGIIRIIFPGDPSMMGTSMGDIDSDDEDDENDEYYDEEEDDFIDSLPDDLKEQLNSPLSEAIKMISNYFDSHGGHENDPFKDNDDIKLSNSQSFTTLKDVMKQRRCIFVKDKNFKSDFYQEFGEKDSYTLKELLDKESDMLSYGEGNEKDIIGLITKFTPIHFEDHYMLCRAKLNDGEKYFDIIVAMARSYDSENILLYLPNYGNNLTLNSQKEIVPIEKEDEDFIDETGSLKIPESIEKIKAECDLTFLKDEKTFTTVSEFGRVLQVQKTPQSSGDKIFIGTIHSNGSYKANQFIKDFNLDRSEKKFNFYVELDSWLDQISLVYLSDFLAWVDFNQDPMVLEADLKDVGDGIGIKLPIQRLEKFIKEWRDE